MNRPFVTNMPQTIKTVQVPFYFSERVYIAFIFIFSVKSILKLNTSKNSRGQEGAFRDNRKKNLQGK